MCFRWWQSVDLNFFTFDVLRFISFGLTFADGQEANTVT